ncbi:beta-ketoacyl-ACP synthase 3 [Streptomyces shenzhenensis]
MSVRTVICGLGACLPERVVTNADLAARLDTSDDWIRTRTGIRRRRVVEPGTSTGDLAVSAGLAAMESGGQEADFVLLATTTPDRPCPATAPEVAHRLGLAEVPAVDVAAVCSGFVYALALADALLKAGTCERPLVIGAEVYTSIIDPQDRDTAVIFGDGAGAVLLRRGRSGEPGAVRAVDLGSAGAGSDLITVAVGGSRHPGRDEEVPPEQRYFRMQGREVYRQAIHRMTESARSVLDRAGWQPPTVRAFIGHQANQRILDSVSDRLGIAARYRYGNIAEVGNTAAASIPLALADAAADGRIRPGSPTVLTAFGGGLTWGSAAVTWPDAVPVYLPPKTPTACLGPQPADGSVPAQRKPLPWRLPASIESPQVP